MFLFRDILTLTGEAFKSRLSLGIASNKTYHFQTTANHHRFIKVWTSIADLPTSKFFVQTFFLEKVWLRNTLPSYDLEVRPNVRSFFSFFFIPLLSISGDANQWPWQAPKAGYNIWFAWLAQSVENTQSSGILAHSNYFWMFENNYHI